ncbi:hypothetical protein EDB81DRAFT_664451 [Dactylonectria macrodidyma]|uniref:SnoaL-like domain-containing protein n=1 Tax=Dactylonectria macrodidyma TaxID=307937 RepID=A0A9P9DRS0_9HYPO|nr:hypothetical protein EDB81DRAFT_664451 [Dactylonectria macrodidyma]
MRASGLLTLCVSALAWAGTAASFSVRPQARVPNCPPRPATLSQQRAILGQFMQAFYVERNATKALLNHVSEDYIQHNPNALSGRQNTLEVLAPVLGSGALNFTLLRQAFDNNVAFIHYRMDLAAGGEPSAVVDVFRFDGTCIMEHWDVIQTRDPSSINPLALF